MAEMVQREGKLPDATRCVPVFVGLLAKSVGSDLDLCAPYTGAFASVRMCTCLHLQSRRVFTPVTAINLNCYSVWGLRHIC